MRATYEIVLWTLLIVASVTDILWGKIYNWITFSAIFLGVFYRFAFISHEEGKIALLGIFVATLIYFPLYYLRIIAAGDVKLLMAIGAWATPKLTFYLALAGILVATFVGLLKIFSNLGLQKTLGHFVQNLSGQKTKLHRIAFAPAFLCSYLLIQILERRGLL